MSTPPDRTPEVLIDAATPKPFDPASLRHRRRGDAILELYAAGRKPTQHATHSAKPAHELGVTPLQATGLFRRPLREVLRIYLRGIGRRDAWDCWWAKRQDLEAEFSPQHVNPTEPLAVQRARSKAELLRAKIERTTAR
jgi:hypothetical protein